MIQMFHGKFLFDSRVEIKLLGWRFFYVFVALIMKTRTIPEATIRRCLLLRHRNVANSFPNDTVYILSKIASRIVKEILYRCSFSIIYYI